MKFNLLKKRSGTTLIEVLIAGVLLSMALICTLVILNTTLNIWAKGASGTSANAYACLATRKLVSEIEEGQKASVVGGNLVVVFPYYNAATGDYVKTAAGNTVTYYLSGKELWKSVGGVNTRLARNVQSVSYTIMPPPPAEGKLVRITLIGEDAAGGAIAPNMVQQSVKLRNN